VDEGLIQPERTEAATDFTPPEPEPRPTDGDTVVARALQADEAVVVEDTGALDNPIDYGDLRSAAGVPIGEQGAIVVGKAREGGFNRMNLRLLEVLGSYAALVSGRLEREEELLAAKEEAEEATELFETILNNVPVMIDLFDAEGDLQMVNEHWEAALGWSEEETKEYTDPTEVLYPVPEERQESIEFMEEAPEEWRDSRFRTKSGEVLDTTWNNVEISNGRRIGIGLDITDQKERERKLRKAKEEAESASKMKSAFLAAMSHEIRTPLTSILGFAEAIEEETEGLEPPVEASALSSLAEFADLIQHSGQRLMETLTGVLNLSRLEAGEIDLAAEPVGLATQAEEIAEELRPQAEEKGLVLHVETGEGPAQARADAGGVQIVLRNLVNNAIKYTEEGTVRVCAYQDESEAVLEVKDTGIGMDPEVAGDLFDPFRQASEGFDREYEGTGLGLAVTKEAVEQMGGRIEMETERGEGTCVTVRLPEATGGASGA
jgi:PAS domain S-box-containing protein